MNRKKSMKNQACVLMLLCLTLLPAVACSGADSRGENDDQNGDQYGAQVFDDFSAISMCKNLMGAYDRFVLEAQSEDPQSCVSLRLVAPGSGVFQGELEVTSGYGIEHLTVYGASCSDARDVPFHEQGALSEGQGSIEITMGDDNSITAKVDVEFRLPDDDSNPYDVDRVSFVWEGELPHC